ncbi:hypothetical protein [Streptomyces sp. NPDC058412]|uniref:hypothetical protein n=1 Tax=Streptomyces sp. NPDC058412 TaxID=3346486 RepID=UPI003658F032
MENLDRERVRPQNPEQQITREVQSKSDVMPRFMPIFSTVAALTFVALILNVLLAAFGGESEQVKAAAEACSTTYMMGFERSWG